MSVSRHIPQDIKRVSRSIGYALWVGSTEQWFGLSMILRARLTSEQRVKLAFQLLRSLDYETAYQTADAVLGEPLDETEAA